MTFETFTKGKTVGVNRDGKPVGHAVRVNRKGESERWTAYVNVDHPMQTTVRIGFPSEAAAVDFIGKNGFAR